MPKSRSSSSKSSPRTKPEEKTSRLLQDLRKADSRLRPQGWEQEVLTALRDWVSQRGRDGVRVVLQTAMYRSGLPRWNTMCGPLQDEFLKRTLACLDDEDWLRGIVLLCPGYDRAWATRALGLMAVMLAASQS